MTSPPVRLGAEVVREMEEADHGSKGSSIADAEGDQSHLNREMRAFTGHSPTGYLRRRAAEFQPAYP